MKDEKAVVEIILKGQQANATLKDIEKSARALRAQMSRLPVDSQEFINKSKELQQVNKRLRDIKDDLKGTSKAFTEIESRLKGFLSIAGAIQAVRTAWNGLKEVIKINKEFEKSLQNLSAITGASAQDLKYYKEQALQMGFSVEGGAKAVVEAFKLIGSAKPELLESKIAMTEVTKAAILLSHAAGMELPDAATRLTDAMNQFGAPASQAIKYADALAASAKWGAAEVPQVTEALLKFGVSAKSFNVDIYESAAAIELLAEKGLKGADAGTMLRNIFSKLSAADVLPRKALDQLSAAGVDINILKDKTIPLQQRLTELSKIAGNAAAITEVFGLENKTAGEIILTNLPRLEQLNNQVRETGVTSQQAAKNMDSLDQAITNAGNAWDNFILSLSSGSFSKGIKQEVQKASIYLQLLSMLFGDRDQQSLNAFRIRVSKMTDETKRYLLEKLRIEIEADLVLMREQKGWSKARILEYEKEIRDKVERLNIYREALIKEKEQETTDTEKQADVQLGIIKKLQDDIAALTEQRINSTSRAEIASLNLLIKQKQEMLDILLGKESENARKIRELYEKLVDDINGMRVENSLFNLTDMEKEFAKAYDDYEKVRDRIINDQKMTEIEKQNALLVLEENHDKKVREITLSYQNKAIKDQKEHLYQYNELINNSYQNEVNDTIEKYSKEIEYFKDNIEKKLELEAQLQVALDEIRKKHTVVPDKINLHADAIKYQEYYSQINDAANIYYDLQRNRNAQESLSLDNKLKNDLAREKRLLDEKVISQSTYDNRVEKLNKEAENRKKEANLKQYEADKKAAKFNAILNGAEAITQIWSKYAAAPYVAAALTAISAGMTYAKIAVIDSTPPPQYAEGGLHDPNGFVNKETMFKSSSGQNFIAGEAGAEWIAPSWMLQDPITANTISALEAIRQNGRSFASGGSTNATASSSKSVNAESGLNIGALLAENARINKLLYSVLANGIEAKIVYDEWIKTQNSIDNARISSEIQ